MTSSSNYYFPQRERERERERDPGWIKLYVEVLKKPIRSRTFTHRVIYVHAFPSLC
jgi:hypothetical protein